MGFGKTARVCRQNAANAVLFYRRVWGRGGVPMSITNSLLQNSEWIVVAIAAAVSMIVGFVSASVSSRKVSLLAKKVERLAQEVDELRGLEDRRLLKEIKYNHGPGEKIEAPPLAHF